MAKTKSATMNLYSHFKSDIDWRFFPYDATLTSARKAQPNAIRPAMNPEEKFCSGDLVKIFKTVSDGKIAWQGNISFERDSLYQHWPQNTNQHIWSAMFHDNLPARLERNGRVIFGHLEPFFEQGMEYIAWAVREYGNADYYAALNILKEGDDLAIYSKVYDGDVEWEGALSFGKKTYSPFSFENEYLSLPLHMNPKMWREMTLQHRPVIVTPKL